MKKLNPGLVIVGMVAATGMLGITLAACGNDSNASTGDLTGIPATRPEKIRAFNNIDGHPNLVELCIGNRAWITTSRQAGENLTRFPDDDIAYCGATSMSPYQVVGNPAKDGPIPVPKPSSS